MRGGIDPGGAITFELFGPNDQTCSTAPAFTTAVAVNGNADYRSAAFVVARPGTYRWVATYSGDAMNTGAGPTACGDQPRPSLSAPARASVPSRAETSQSRPSPHPKPKPPPPPPRPIVTG